MKEVKKDDTVKVHFKCKTDDGQIFSSKDNNKPLSFKVGEGRLLKDIESGVVGMKVNEKKTININHEQAYGVVNEELIKEIDRNLLPKDIEPKVGLELFAKEPDGKEIKVRIIKVMENSIIIDANHPLAGKDLEFEIELIEIA
jgi:FKBP-type peptidyl-prolyl cis-trans isomerase 2